MGTKAQKGFKCNMVYAVHSRCRKIHASPMVLAKGSGTTRTELGNPHLAHEFSGKAPASLSQAMCAYSRAASRRVYCKAAADVWPPCACSFGTIPTATCQDCVVTAPTTERRSGTVQRVCVRLPALLAHQDKVVNLECTNGTPCRSFRPGTEACVQRVHRSHADPPLT